MSTRNTNNEPLFPITNPEEILQAARRRARLDAALAASNPISVPLPRSPPGTSPQPTLFDEPYTMQQSSGSSGAQYPPAPPASPNQEVEGELSITDCFKTLLTIQKNTAVQFQAAQLQAKRAQAQADKQRRHDAERFAAVEEQRRLDNERFAEQRQLRQTIKHLEMSNSESFMEYSGRARTLQSLVNFKKESFSDYDLAEFVMFGLPHALKTKVKDFQLLAAKNFNYSKFESRTNSFYASLPRPRVTATGAPSTLSSNPMERLDPDAYLWRLFSYLDSVGKCHFCKKHCGNLAGACPGPQERRIFIPPSFVVPPKPVNYVAPRAWKNAQGPLTSSAGKATGRPAGVAAASAEAPAFDEAGISAVAVMEGHMEAEALNYGNDPLTFIKRDREDSEPSDTKDTPVKAKTLSLADVQMADTSQWEY
ncbi:hypothetical protein PTTG_04072 [Puccinia triticina 1-1 BBBD Race 1]|uniref:Uncharacterized protein n=1 Tax=Puccinia triticina (isolate 1-1 / race 1 (BBBD)) TaxID=630390 RepID=A0A0C4ETE3_PUCT1|nr:hypothetical protein PTTG_04072 [Puccinia triticina 1-1 BBBD Race 1]